MKSQLESPILQVFLPGIIPNLLSCNPPHLVDNNFKHEENIHCTFLETLSGEQEVELLDAQPTGLDVDAALSWFLHKTHRTHSWSWTLRLISAHFLSPSRKLASTSRTLPNRHSSVHQPIHIHLWLPWGAGAVSAAWALILIDFAVNLPYTQEPSEMVLFPKQTQNRPALCKSHQSPVLSDQVIKHPAHTDSSLPTEAASRSEAWASGAT